MLPPRPWLGFFVFTMIIKVKVKPRSKKNQVRKLIDGSWVVCVKAPPTDGAANEMVREVLAEYLGKSKRNVILKSGFASKFKLLEIT
ncbi:MAG: UPF0235 protein yggU [Bacteroidetes bacterium]|nr:UPF0235 protein yggU [Bacteroidota bacterium]